MQTYLCAIRAHPMVDGDFVLLGIVNASDAGKVLEFAELEAKARNMLAAKISVAAQGAFLKLELGEK